VDIPKQGQGHPFGRIFSVQEKEEKVQWQCDGQEKEKD